LLPAFVVPLVAAMQGRVFIKMAPSLGLLLYAVALLTFNRTLFSIGPEGVVVRYGPLPTGLGTFRVGIGEIAMVYVWRSEVKRHMRTIVKRSAGVGLTNGHRVDIGEGVDAAAEAKAVGWTQGVAHVERGAPRWGMVARRAVIPLAGAVGVCWLWASYHCGDACEPGGQM
jgi:hypothetical protein